LTLSQEIKGKIERANRACDAPSFDHGIDSPQKVDNQVPSKNANPSTTGITLVDLHSTNFAILDDDWDEATWKEACDVVDKVEREKCYSNDKHNSSSNFVQPKSGYLTPVKVANSTSVSSQPSGSTTAVDRPVAERRKIIRLAMAMRSPYIPLDDKTLFNCSVDVKELYNAVIARGRRSTRGQDVDDTPIVVSYDKFFVSLKELANSMIPLGELKTIVI
jgi:hypothetical protein